jgi:hypothetical protein
MMEYLLLCEDLGMVSYTAFRFVRMYQPNLSHVRNLSWVFMVGLCIYLSSFVADNFLS